MLLCAFASRGDVERALQCAIRWEDETDGEDSLNLWKHMIEAGYLASRADVVSHVVPHIVALSEPDLSGLRRKVKQPDIPDDEQQDANPIALAAMLPAMGMPRGVLPSLRALSAIFCADLGLATEARELAALAASSSGDDDVEGQLINELCAAWLAAKLDGNVEGAVTTLDRLSSQSHGQLTYIAPLAASLRLLLQSTVATATADNAAASYSRPWLDNATYSAARALQRAETTDATLRAHSRAFTFGRVHPVIRRQLFLKKK
jgi:hypothetical protein